VGAIDGYLEASVTQSFLTETLSKLRFYESSTLSTPPNMTSGSSVWGGPELGEKDFSNYSI
jgi:hypothetical protein